MAHKHALLNQGEENEMEIFGYKTTTRRSNFCLVGYILSLGILRLFFYWKPQWDVWCQCVECSLAEADVILLRTTNELKQYSKKKVIVIYPNVPDKNTFDWIVADKNSHLMKSIIEPEYKVRYIKVQKIRYVWNNSDRKFQKIGILDKELSCSDIHSKYGSGLTKEEQELRKQVCGLNTIEVEMIPIWKLFFKKIFNPFYIFQAYAFSLWMVIEYFEYGLVIIILTFMSIIASIYILRMQSVKLNKMSTSYNSIMVTVLHKNGELKEVESQYLVPGEVIILTANKFFLPCDAVLISGGCTVNEGMLTGECIPVTKTPLPNIDNSIPWRSQSGDDYKRHVLYCGTEVIQTKAHDQALVKAVVLQTGFNTAKGDLVRCILYNRPINIKLHREAMKFLMCLLAVAICGFIYSVIIHTRAGASTRDIILFSCFMLTMAVNPALPGALTLGLLYAQMRLKKLGIFCITPQRIIISGRLNLICFDKTGTLTEDVLYLWGVVPCDGGCLQDVHKFPSGNTMPWSPLLAAMTSCHSLIILEGKIQGDPLDVKMFEATGWELEDYTTCSNEDRKSISCTMAKPGTNVGEAPVKGISILRQFPFSSSLKRMSVITQVIGSEELTLFMKGAPEMVIQFCKPSSAPHNFSKRLDYYTMKGFRVIGLAYRILHEDVFPVIHTLEREEIEHDLTFLGFLIMENRLKPESTSVIQELSAANIRTVMITGDNLQTAVTVGRDCRMIPRTAKLILIEAEAPEGDKAASISWTVMTENQENEQKDQEIFLEVDNTDEAPGTYQFVLSGKTYQVILQHFSNLVPKILLNASIIARMTPRQKSSVVEDLQKLDYYVGMCGDGANDCGALKMAHAGISLSELEASIASPFTSKIPSIECVPRLIKEGRNTLVTAFSLFKFLTMITLIGFTSDVLLFWKQTVLGNYHFLMNDTTITIVVFLTSSLNGPTCNLAKYRPSGHLLSPALLVSFILHYTFTVILQTSAFILVQQQPWYNESDVFSGCLLENQNHIVGNYTTREPALSVNYLTTTLWPITGINLIILEFVFSKGHPFRQRLHTNYVLCIAMTLQLSAYLFLLFADIEPVYITMELVCTPYYWRIYIVVMLLIMFIVSYAVEEGLIENRKLWLWIKKTCNYQPKSQYKKLQKMIENDPDWPPQNRID